MGHYEINGLMPEGYQSLSCFSSSEYDDIWLEAEHKAADLVAQIQPSRASEQRRKAVINYVQCLIERKFNCKVFPFGSVPLKTYLPDGDIDLTAISDLRHFNDKTWADEVSKILQQEEHNHKSEFHVKEVKCIFAEVPVVKCLVENIIVDISFNQLGGLSTLCFLEEIDKKIGRDHLFKRSIILVKAWCFYESRILGAHYGLLSTYALEVLVLYVFHIFNESLRGPLEVLFKFLQYFSKFDWEKYCLSLWGPIPLASLHSMTVEPIQNPAGKYLLSEQYLISCREIYNTLSEGSQGKTFSQKHINLVDPLRPFNNLGRSVNKGNFVRIYSAFAYGAAQLEKLLQSPKEKLSEGLAAFFRNTQGHCRALRLDVVSILGSSVNASYCNCKMRSKDCMEKIHVSPPHEQEQSDEHNGGCLTDCASSAVQLEKRDCDEDTSALSQFVESKAAKPSSTFEEMICENVHHNMNSPIRDTEMIKLEQEDTELESAYMEVNNHSVETGLQEDFTDHSHSCPARNTDVNADILEGDYQTHFKNLEDGWRRQNSNSLYGYNIYHPPLGAVWEGPGPVIDHYSQSASNRSGIPSSSHGVPPQERYSILNGMLPESFPKYPKGTGTFFPNLKPNFEREKQLLQNGSRVPRPRIGSTDFGGSNYNAASAFRPRQNKRDAQNKQRSRKPADLKAGDQEWNSLIDDSVPANAFTSSTTNAVDNFSASFQKQMDIGTSDARANMVDSPISSPTVPASNSKKLHLEDLRFGSFGPGFLSPGNKDNIASLLQNPHQHHPHSADSSASGLTEAVPVVESQKQAANMISTEVNAEALNPANNVDNIKSYQLKEEDFPPLAFGKQRESPTATQKNTAAARRSYHEACLIGNST